MSIVIETTLGDITVDLFLEQRPVACLNFLKLCKMKYYNFNLFHSIRSGFIAQTGDPSGEGSGGEAIFGLLEGPDKRFFMGEKLPKIRHTNTGTLSMVCTGDMMVGSQFFFTLAPDLDSLDSVHCVIGEVTEGHDVLRKLNDVICDESHRPYRDVRITHTVVLEDPFNDPAGFRVPSRSPSPSAERLKGGRIAPDEDVDEAQGKTAEEVQELIEEKEAKARATILEIVGDLPDADIAPPENVLFVCKLNPVTTDEDLEIIFSRFGKIVGCEVIRDKKTGDSLQYAFIEFADKKSCEDAYFKMDNVLIDDRRIHVDFSQSVSRMKWFGKGRGIKYFNDNEAKNTAINNHSPKHHYDNQEKRESKNGKIDGNKRRPKSKDREDYYKSDSRYKKSDKDQSRSRSKNKSQLSRATSKRDESGSRTKDISRKRRSKTRSVSKSKKERSHSRGRSRREQNRSSSGHHSTRKRSRSGHRSRRDRSGSKRDKSTQKSKTTKDRSRSCTRGEKLHKEKSDKPQETLSAENRGRTNSTSTEKQYKAEQSHDQTYKKKNKTSKYQSVSPINERIRSKSRSKDELSKDTIKRWKSVSETKYTSEEQPETALQCGIHENDTTLPAIDYKQASIEKNTSNPIGKKGNDYIEKEDSKAIKKKTEFSDKEHKKKHALVNEHKTSLQIKEVSKTFVEKDARTPTPVIKNKNMKSKITDKKKYKQKKNTKNSMSKRKRKSSTSDSSSDSSSSESSSSSEDNRKKKSLKRRKKKISTSSSSSSSSASSSSSSTDSSSSSSTSSDSEPVKKKHKKNGSSKVIKTKKTKKKP